MDLGANENGQLGIGTTTNVNAPTQVAGLSGIKAISGGLGYHGMALSENGSVWTWGRNVNGELGNGTTIQQNFPVQVSGLNDVTAIATGGYYSLALKSDGTIWAWGVNGDGELGDGTTTDRYMPVQVAGLTDVIAIAAGGLIVWPLNKTAPSGHGEKTHTACLVTAREQTERDRCRFEAWSILLRLQAVGTTVLQWTKQETYGAGGITVRSSSA